MTTTICFVDSAMATRGRKKDRSSDRSISILDIGRRRSLEWMIELDGSCEDRQLTVSWKLVRRPQLKKLEVVDFDFDVDFQ